MGNIFSGTVGPAELSRSLQVVDLQSCQEGPTGGSCCLVTRQGVRPHHRACLVVEHRASVPVDAKPRRHWGISLRSGMRMISWTLCMLDSFPVLESIHFSLQGASGHSLQHTALTTATLTKGYSVARCRVGNPCSTAEGDGVALNPFEYMAPQGLAALGKRGASRVGWQGA